MDDATFSNRLYIYMYIYKRLIHGYDEEEMFYTNTYKLW